MRRTDVNRLAATSRALATACAAAMLVATPLAASAQWGGGAAVVHAAPKDEPVRPAEGGAAAPDTAQWQEFSVEVYGKLVSRTGKVATLLPLVATTTTPVAAGTKAVLFRKIDDPVGPKATKWVEIAKVTMQKIEPTGNMQLTIDTEAPLSTSGGKATNYFVKGARFKLAIE